MNKNLLTNHLDINNVPVWIINLKGKEANFQKLLRQLVSQSFFDVNRYEAVKGSDLTVTYDNVPFQGLTAPIPISLQAFIDLKEGRVLHRSLSSKGAIGCALSHFMLWKMMIDQNISSMIILEDDIKLPMNLAQNLQPIVQNLEFDMLSFGYLSTRFNRQNLENESRVVKGIGEFHGLQGYMITQQGAWKLMQRFFPLEMQVDSYVGFIAKNDPNFLLLFTTKSMANQEVHKSSVQDICVLCNINDLYTEGMIGKRARIRLGIIFLILISMIIWLVSWFERKK